MSIRIGLYDFFAYTIPGVFYLFIIGFWLNVLGLMHLNLIILNQFSLLFLFIILGIGYVLGLLIDPLAFLWVRQFQGRNRDAAKAAYLNFKNRHKWVSLDFDSVDWIILLRAVKSKSLEAGAEVEQHNVAAIMLRNISLALLISAGSCLLYFFVIDHNILILFLFLPFYLLALVAMRSGRKRRDWFYLGIFEAFTAHFLLEEKIENAKSREKDE